MNLWDSVHRGLEKASQEAARLARMQRLRATMDGMTRQVNVLHNNLISRTMDLYIAGQLAQSELLPICQELAGLQQQIQQIQNELRQLQAIQTQQQPQGPGSGIIAQPGGEAGAYAPPPPDYQSYVDAGPITAPPPPGEELHAMSGMETLLAPPPPGMAPVQPPVPVPAGVHRFCPSCHAELNPGHAFCQNCGTPVQNDAALHMPTVRSGTGTPFSTDEQETIRGSVAEGTPAESQQPDVAPPPATEEKGV
jgi:hypothetical protein